MLSNIDTKTILSGVLITILGAFLMGASSAVSEADSRSKTNAIKIDGLVEKEQRLHSQVEVIHNDVKEILKRLPE